MFARQLRFTKQFSIICFILLAFSVASWGSAATLRVNTLIDNFSDDANGECTLREAIVSINRGRNSGFCFALSGGAYGTNDTILLPAGVYSIVGTPQPPGLLGAFTINPDSANTEVFYINKSLTLKGSNALTTIIQPRHFATTFIIGCLQCGFEPIVKFENLTIQNSQGHSIIHSAGKLSLEDVVIKNSKRGAITSQSNLSIRNSTIHSNVATLGAGLHLSSENADAYIENSTFSNNIATLNGGGIYVDSNAKLFLASSTVAHNLAGSRSGGSGGGIFSQAPSTNVRVENSLITSNTHVTSLRAASHDCFGSFSSLGYNLISDATNCAGFSSSNNDLLGNSEDRLATNLSDLKLHDGNLIPTHALQAGSPAIDAGGLAFDEACLPKDQTGKTRPLKGSSRSDIRCDIGAYEAPVGTSVTTSSPADARADLKVNIRVNPRTVFEGDTVQIIVSVTNEGPNTANTAELSVSLDRDATYLNSDCSFTTNVDCFLGNIASGSSVERIINIRAPESVNRFTYLKTIARASSRTQDNDTTNNSDTETRRPKVSSRPKADMQALIAASQEIEISQQGSIELALKNVTGNRVSRLTAELSFPEEIDWLESSLSACLQTSVKTLICSFGGLSENELNTMVLAFNAPSSATELDFKLGVISTAGNYTETNAGNNSASLSLNVVPSVVEQQSADLALTFNQTTDVLLADESRNYELSVTNNGPNTAQKTIVSFTLPDELTASISGSDCTNLECRFGSLDSGATQTLLISLEGTTQATDLNLSASASSDTADPVSFNNDTTLSLSVVTAEAILPTLVAEQLSQEETLQIKESSRDLAVLNLSLKSNSQEPVTLQNLNLLSSGTGNDANDISQVQLFLDVDNNGRLSFADERLSSTAIQEDNGTLSFEITNLTLEPNESLAFIVAIDVRTELLAGLGISSFLALLILPFWKRKRRLGLSLILCLVLASCIQGKPPETPQPVETKDVLSYQLSLQSVMFKGLDSNLNNSLTDLNFKSTVLELEK